MPIAILIAAVAVTGGLGAYAIHTSGQGLNSAVQATGQGLSNAETIVGIAVGAGVLIWVVSEYAKK